jgi:hypothetical protein
MASGPRSFNIVTFLMLLTIAAAGYWVWKFFPVYFTAWQVDHVLADGASRSYQMSRMREPFQSKEKAVLIESMRKKIVALGIVDPEMTVDIEIEGQEATVTCDYSVVVSHPVADKVTLMSMHRMATGDLKKVVWDTN